MSLADMPGEIWKPLPGMEDYYLISNKGRIKALSRLMEKDCHTYTASYIINEYIRKQVLFKTYNKYTRKYTYGLRITITVDKKKIEFKISRAVYEAFINKTDLTNKTVVAHKDNDPLNNRVENLYIKTRQDVSFNLAKNIREVFIRREWTNDQIKATRIPAVGEPVSQYDNNGNCLASYLDPTEAFLKTGISPQSIRQSIRPKYHHRKAGEFYWRKGENSDKTPIIIPPIPPRKKPVNNVYYYKQIVQYDPQGKLLGIYKSVSEASRKTGIPAYRIIEIAKGRKYLSIKFIWKYKSSFDIVPEQIPVTPPSLPEPEKVTKSREEAGFPICAYPYEDLYLGDLDNEIWKNIPGLEGYYQVSNMGRIKTTNRFVDRPGHGCLLMTERIVNQRTHFSKHTKYEINKNKNLHFHCCINKTARLIAVATAVYSAFIAPLNIFDQKNISITHKDGDKRNNRVENLLLKSK